MRYVLPDDVNPMNSFILPNSRPPASKWSKLESPVAYFLISLSDLERSAADSLGLNDFKGLLYLAEEWNGHLKSTYNGTAQLFEVPRRQSSDLVQLVGRLL